MIIDKYTQLWPKIQYLAPHKLLLLLTRWSTFSILWGSCSCYIDHFNSYA